MINNVWNVRQDESGRIRSFDSTRPWYHFALAVLEQVTERGEALDVGCGVGEFLGYLQAQGYHAQGIDGSAEQIQVVLARGYKASVADLERELPFVDGSFNLISCLEVIEHISQAEFLLSEFRRILRPGGYLMLSTPNFAFLNHRLRYLLGAGPFMEGIHLRFFTRTRLRDCLEKAGFRVLASNSYGVLPILSGLETRLFKKSPRQIRIPPVLESSFASDFVYLAR